MRAEQLRAIDDKQRSREYMVVVMIRLEKRPTKVEALAKPSRLECVLPPPLLPAQFLHIPSA